jgi:hypothetical protein
MSFDLMMGREDGKRLVVIPIAPPFDFNKAVHPAKDVRCDREALSRQCPPATF